ncbi:ras-related protein Rab-43-like [Sycon ciliatum]|uniref:ras-related protein Rab-43-like n=1 Tax=Sycon ciliatum TaxID=27933 RepID=UPI0020A94D41|eukprot:scpid56091/ scgid30445/ Ras-related protein RABB1b; Ras-related protein GB2; Ras-related protein Rab2C
MAVQPDVLTMKIVLLGEVNVGKTALFHRLKTGTFSASASSTLGMETVEREFTVDGEPVRLQIWDTAGSEKYRTLTANYYRGAAAVLYVYDLSEEESLFGLVAWMDDARRFQPDHMAILIGNKCDLESEDVVLTEATIQSFYQDNDFELSLCMSAKSGQGVDACFHEVARALLARSSGANATNGYSPGVALDDAQRRESQQDGGCCS